MFIKSDIFKKHYIKLFLKAPKSRSTSEDSLERTHYEILESISHEAPDYIGEAEKLMHEIKSKRNSYITDECHFKTILYYIIN